MAPFEGLTFEGFAGVNKEEAAHFAVDRRRQLTIEYKGITPDDLMEWIFKFNEDRYVKTGLGDKWGMTWEGVSKKYGTNYDAIINGSSKPLGTKQDLGNALRDHFESIDPKEYEKLKNVLAKYRM